MEQVAPYIPHELPIDGLPQFLRTFQYSTVTMGIVAAMFLVLLFWLGTRRLKMVPGRGQALLESFVVAFRDLVYSTMGERDGRKYLPLIGSIFLFVFTANMMGLIPMGEILGHTTGSTMVALPVGEHSILIPALTEPTKNVNSPWALGIMVFFIMHTAAILRKGPARYFDEYFTPHLGRITWPNHKPLMRTVGALILALIWAGLAGLVAWIAGHPQQNILIAMGVVGGISLVWCLVRISHQPTKVGVPNVFMFPLNAIGKVVEILSLSFRLFGNIFGGVIIIALLGGMVHQIALPIVLLAFVGIFVGAIQAFVFAMLSLTYITVEIAEEDEVEESLEGDLDTSEGTGPELKEV